MAAVNWFCLLLVLAFAFINGYVCIKVDPNIPNGNYTTTIGLNSQQTTILPYKVYDDNEPDNITLLGGGDTELSASERTRRLIPYMAFYVPVSQLPINKQYATISNNPNHNHNHNNIHMTKQSTQQALIRPASATGVGGSGAGGPTGPTASTHIPIPSQYVHNTGGLQYLPAAGPSAGPTHSVVSGQNYQPNAGLGYYQTHNAGSGSSSSSSGSGYGGGHIQSQAQYHLLPPATTGHSQYLQPPGPPGPSVLGLPAGPVTNKANGNQAFVTFKEVKGPIRHKTVQHFPPLSATTSSASSASASLSVLKQQQQQKLKSLGGGGTAGIAASAAGVYRPRTKQQSKINLTPFTPANSVPGNFVPIVYTPVNTNNNHNNNNNNILHSPTSPAKGIATIDDTQLFSHNENQQQHQQQQQQQQQYYKQQQSSQIPIEYSSGPLPQTAPDTAISVPIHVPSSVAQRQHPHHHHHHNPTPVKQQQQSQYFSVTTSPLSPVNVDLTHDVGAAVYSGETGGGVQHPHAHQHHHHHLHQNTPAISPPLPTTAIYHQNPQQQQQQQNHQQAEHVIIDGAHQQPQTVTLIGSKQQQQQQQEQQQQFYHDKSVAQFQPPKPESFFESEIHIRQQQQQQQQQQHRHHHQHHQNIDQVLKDVNSYSIKSSHVMTPQEKYVMYLQQRMNYNKQQQQQQQQHFATRQKYREHKHQEREQQQQQFINKQQHQNPTQIFVLSSTISPSLDTTAIVAVPSATAAAAAVPIRPSSPPPPPLLSPPAPSPVQQHYDTNYPQHSPIHHDLYPKANPSASGGSVGGSVNGVGVVGSGAGTGSGQQEHILTIPVHSLFGELETLQKQTHYSQTHSSLPSTPSTSHNNNKPYPKIGPSTPQYIDYIIDEPKQSLDDEHHQAVVQSHRNNQHSQHRQQAPHNQLELLKPTLGPPSHAFILVTTAAPYPQDPVTQENYGSSVRPPYKSKPKIRLQPVLKENNVNYPAIRQQHHPTGRPLVVAITPTPKTIINNHQAGEEDLSPKYVYVNEEFGQKIPTVQGAVKLKPSNKYESDDNQISHQQRQHQHIPLHSPAHNVVNVDETTVPSLPSPPPTKTVLADPNELPDIRTSSLAEILHKLQESNHLPHTLTPDNIDNSIKTLIRILNNLKQTQTIVANPPQHHETPTHHSHPSSPDYDYSTGSEEEEQHKQQQHVEQQPQDIQILAPTGPNKHPGPSTGRPGIDYPNYAEIPETSFDCSQQRYKGFFGDPETNCQVWHYCDLNGGKASFLCPNGTIFSQIALTCDWWFNVKCATTAQLYVLNERLYKYILPFTPKFPEDYSGPLVDKYLAMKFQEMEEKMRLEKEKAQREESEEAATATEHEQPDTTVTEESKDDHNLDETTTEDNVHRQIKSHSTVIPINHKHESVNSQVSEQSSERNLLIDDEVNDISQRGKPDDFESTTISTMTATIKSDAISFSLKPIIVSSTLGPDYDEENIQHLDNKRSYNPENTTKEITITKTENETETVDEEVKVSSSTESPMENKMQISVEKVDVIEIKPDGATGHLIRDMLMHSKHNK